MAWARSPAAWATVHRPEVRGQHLASTGNAVIHHPGEVATAAAGIGLMLLRSGGEGIGVALDATGAGAVVGVPLNVVSAAGLAGGAPMTTAAGASLMQHAASDDAVSPMQGSQPSRSVPRRPIG
ncbi:hypothetical protein [Actinoplanes sp. OR16]|uniref:hypothetical protein n=1 Tax=Actinoplanes sp. OR16 TaxID=946334 RepID=UPI0011AEE623|nr:hypothetical protein [Actinoplanes sp. OR16]